MEFNFQLYILALVVIVIVVVFIELIRKGLDKIEELIDWKALSRFGNCVRRQWGRLPELVKKIIAIIIMMHFVLLFGYLSSICG